MATATDAGCCCCSVNILASVSNVCVHILSVTYIRGVCATLNKQGVCFWTSGHWVRYVYECMTHWILFALENIVQMTLRNVFKAKVWGQINGQTRIKSVTTKRLTDRPKHQCEWLQREGVSKNVIQLRDLSSSPFLHFTFSHISISHRRSFHTCHVIGGLQFEIEIVRK